MVVFCFIEHILFSAAIFEYPSFRENHETKEAIFLPLYKNLKTIIKNIFIHKTNDNNNNNDHSFGYCALNGTYVLIMRNSNISVFEVVDDFVILALGNFYLTLNCREIQPNLPYRG